MARARREWVDQVTGQPVPGPRVGAVESGRYVARVRAAKGAPLVTVEVDPEDVHTADASFAVDRAAVEGLRAQAAKAAKAAKAKPKRKAKRQRLPGVAETYRSAGKAAEVFAAGEGNWQVIDDASESGDPHDFVRDWLDGVEVRRGRGFRRLRETKKGAALLRYFKAGPDRDVRRGILAVLTWLFSQGRSKRWDRAPWSMVRSFGDALAADCETNVRPHVAPGEPLSGCAGWQWFPLASGEVDPESVLEELPEAAAAQVSAQANQERLRAEVAALAKAYKAARACMPKATQAAVRRRLRFLRALVKEPERIEHLYLCAPEGWGRLCGFHAVAADIARIERACAEPYRADWPEVEARQGKTTPGLPDAVERLTTDAAAEPEPEGRLITEEELAAMPHPAEANPTDPEVKKALTWLKGSEKYALADVERFGIVDVATRYAKQAGVAGRKMARALDIIGGLVDPESNPEVTRVQWEQALARDEKMLRHYQEALRKLQRGGKVQHLTKKGAREAIAGLRATIKHKRKMLATLPNPAGPWGDLTDLRGRETHVLAVRVRHNGRELEHVWHDNHPRLKWSEDRGALVWVHGGRESAKVLAQKQNPAGRALHIVYRQAKARGAAGTTDYKHDFGPGVRLRRGSGRTPSLFSISGGKLKSTGRGLVG